ncbi:MAG: hypothetical protein ACLU0O_03170 [Collinsella sp.]
MSLRDAVRAHEADIAHALKTDLESVATRPICARLAHRFPRFDIRLRMYPMESSAPASVRLANAVSAGKRNRALWRHAHHGALELSVFADARAARWPLPRAIPWSSSRAPMPGIERGAQQICEEAFDPRLVDGRGRRAENPALLDEHWDKIFFTGSVPVGKLVMERASKTLRL